MEIRQLEYVVAVVEHGTFTEAARSIPVSQPALSQGVRALERELGLDLFHRIGRSVVLSDAGRAFVPHARQVLAGLRRGLQAVDEVVGLHGGTLELVALATLAVTPLVELIGEFRRAHPAVALRVREHDGASGTALALVGDGTCELGLVELPDAGLPSGLVAQTLRRQEFLAVCPPGTELARRDVITADELVGLPLAATPEGTSSRRVLDDACARAGAGTPPIAVESWHRELLGPLVLSGAAAAVLPRPMAEAAAAQGAVIAAFEPPVERTIGLVHRTGTPSPAASAFLGIASRLAATHDDGTHRRPPERVG